MATKQRPTRSAVSAKKPVARAARPSKSARPVAAKRALASGLRKAARPSKPAGRRPAVHSDGRPNRPTAVTRVAAGPPAASLGPTSHDLAVEVFERGFRALQERQFREASALLSSIFNAYPDEKELHERARVYLVICERQSSQQRDQSPRTVEERINAATVAINRGAYREGLEFLRSVEREESDNDLVHYMMAVAHAGLGDVGAALPQLHQAVELNPDNRYLAAQDTDLDPIRSHADFAALLDSPPPPRRRATRARSTR